MSTTPSEYDYLFKFLLAGDYNSGRSSFLLRYADATFVSDHNATIGVDFKIKTLTSPESNKRIKLQVWDTASRERFRQITSSYYRGAVGIFFLFSVTDRDSFRSVTRFFEDSNRYSISHVQRILVGTKIDEVEKRQVSYEEAKELADHLGVPYIETSAKNNTNVDEAVNTLVRLVETNWELIQQEMPSIVKPSSASTTPSADRRCILM